jgi:hypothetical protein
MSVESNKAVNKKDNLKVRHVVYTNNQIMPSTETKNLDNLDNEYSLNKVEMSKSNYKNYYSWDISEDCNVVLRQSSVEEFLLQCLTTECGIPEEIYLKMLGRLGILVSKKFKDSVLSRVFKENGNFKLLKGD